MKIVNENDNQLPLTDVEKLIAVDDRIDLNNCNLVHCFLLLKNQSREEGYIVILDEQLVFIEPDNQRIGLVSAKYTANLQNVDVCLDKDDSRSLLVTIRPNAANGSQPKFGAPDLNSGPSKHSNTNVKLLFDDYIRCKVTEQHISRGKHNVIQRKLRKIANLIDIQLDANSTSQQSSNGILSNNSKSRSRNLRYANSSHHPQSGLAIPGGAQMMMFERNGSSGSKSSTINNGNKLNKRVSSRSSSLSSQHRTSTKNSRTNSRDNSPKPPLPQEQQTIQEIPMSDFKSPKNLRKKLSDKCMTLSSLQSNSEKSTVSVFSHEMENESAND